MRSDSSGDDGGCGLDSASPSHLRQAGRTRTARVMPVQPRSLSRSVPTPSPPKWPMLRSATDRDDRGAVRVRLWIAADGAEPEHDHEEEWDKHGAAPRGPCLRALIVCAAVPTCLSYVIMGRYARI